MTLQLQTCSSLSHCWYAFQTVLQPCLTKFYALLVHRFKMHRVSCTFLDIFILWKQVQCCWGVDEIAVQKNHTECQHEEKLLGKTSDYLLVEKDENLPLIVIFETVGPFLPIKLHNLNCEDLRNNHSLLHFITYVNAGLEQQHIPLSKDIHWQNSRYEDTSVPLQPESSSALHPYGHI